MNLSKTRIIYFNRFSYLRNDLQFFKELHKVYHLDFHRQKTKFDEWNLGNPHISSPTHNMFWTPRLDRANALTCTAFGLEYPTTRDMIAPGTAQSNSSKSLSVPPLHQNQLQRLSLYLQLRHPMDHDLGNGKDHAGKVVSPKDHYLTENTIIIFHPMTNSSLSGELLPGDEPWHQLVEDVNSTKSDADHPIALAVIRLLFESVSSRWDDYILSMHKDIIGLEEKIYQNPAEDAQSTALWNISRQILQAERLLTSHIQLLETLQDRLAFLITFESQQSTDWLKQHIEEYQRLGTLIEEVLKKPNEHLIDLMYKSVSIRDARQSLELNNSLWRLSWITFIFLPLTFLVGFFGMNVDTFQQNPSLKWYFIAVVPLMVFVLLAWLATRQWMRKDVNLLQAMRKAFSLRSGNLKAESPAWCWHPEAQISARL